MKTTFITLVAAGFAAAQNFGGQPDCAIPCLRDGLAHAGCNPADVACICRPDTQQRLMGMVTPCIFSKCTPDEVARVAHAAAVACGQASGAHPGAPGAPGAPVGPGAPGIPAPPRSDYPPSPALPGSSYVSGTWVAGVPVTGAPSDGSHTWSTQTNPGLVPTPGASRTYPGDDDDYTSSLWGSGTSTWSSHTGLITSVFSTNSDGSIVATATQSNGVASSTTVGSPGVTGAAPGGPAAGALAAVLAFALAL